MHKIIFGTLNKNSKVRLITFSQIELKKYCESKFPIEFIYSYLRYNSFMFFNIYWESFIGSQLLIHSHFTTNF